MAGGIAVYYKTSVYLPRAASTETAPNFVAGTRGGYARCKNEAGSIVDANEVVQLSHEFAQLGKELRGEGDNNAALQRMVQLAVKYIEPCTGASITVVERGVGRSLATSDAPAARADVLQYELDDGPCLRSAERDQNYLLFDVTTDARWPRFCAALAEQTAYRCVLSFQLEVQDSAALNLFAEQPGAFSDDDVDLAAVFAAHTTSLVALHEAEDHAAHLEVALQTNREIGAAIGVLMAHHKVTQDDAFALLRTASQSLHRKLRDVASEVVATGTLPDQA
jgi:hypothetical protein